MAQTVPLDPARRGIGRRLMWGSIGIVATLTVLGQVFFLWHAAATGALTNASVVPRNGSFVHRLDAALDGALGKSDRGVRRFQISSVQTDRSNPRLKNIGITWALNRDLGAGTVGNGGMLDAYSILRALYTSRLPVASVSLIGTYSDTESNAEAVVMRLSMSRKASRVVNEAGWDTMDPQTVWPLLTRYYVAPGFQPLPSY